MFGLLVCQVGCVCVCVCDTLISVGPEHEQSVLVCRKYFSGNDSTQSEEQKETEHTLHVVGLKFCQSLNNMYHMS